MKTVLPLIFLCVLACQATAQTKMSTAKRHALTINFMLNDFRTASLIKQSSIGEVLNNKNWSHINEMGAGLGFEYITGITPHIDFSGRIDISSVDYFLKSTFTEEATYKKALIEADGNIRFKLLTDDYTVVPYVSAGLGASRYSVYYGLYAPVGAGLQFNLGKKDAFVFTSLQYRAGLTGNANSHFNYSLGVAATLP